MIKNKMMLNFFFILFSFSMLFFTFFTFFMKSGSMYFFSWEFMLTNSNSLEFVIYLDWMSLSFLSVVFFISSMVCLYSMEYMTFKKNQFISLIFLFVVSMMLLIISSNLMSILIGWDGLGLVSYILIIFFQSDKSKNSGMLTIMLNRIGDILIIFSSWVLFMKGGLNFFFFNYISDYYILIFIILAAMTKSAQIPFSSWLPAAMAAPTPVSSLVHSSTLVTAGVYLMIRFSSYFFLCSIYMKFILLFSTLTMFMSGLAANFEMDLKKIIALSTLSQLGLMMMTLSMNFIMLSFFHLLTHALFKALLFLCAGIILHNLKNNQDIQYMGKMVQSMPFTVTCFNVANLALCGFMYLSGFYSKDLILDNFSMNKNNLFIFLILLISTGLTISYTLRLIFFMSTNNFNSFSFLKQKESKIFSLVLLFMTILSISMGFLFNMTLFMIFYEPKDIFFFEKMIIPMIFFMAFNHSFFFWKKKKTFYSSLWFLNFTTMSLKNLPIYWTGKTFNSTNFGFFEFFSSQSLYKFLINLSMKNNLYMMNNFKVLMFLSMIIFLLLKNFYL